MRLFIRFEFGSFEIVSIFGFRASKSDPVDEEQLYHHFGYKMIHKHLSGGN